MTYTHPDQPTAPRTIQAGLYGADLDEIIAGFRGTGVRMGCTVTASGLNVAIAAGVVFIDGKLIPVAAQTVGPVSPPGSPQYRWYLVEIDTNGAGSLKAGTPTNWDTTVNPIKPRPTSGRCVLADVFVANSISSLSTVNDITPRQIPCLRPPTRNYYLREWGVTWLSTPTAITAAFNTALPWIRTNAPGGALIVDAAPANTPWIVNNTVALRTGYKILGEDPILSNVKLADNIGTDVEIFALDFSTEQYGILVDGFTIDGNRYNQPGGHGSGAINLTSGLYRHHIKISNMRIFRPSFYGISNSGIGLKEFITYEDIYIENSGSDGCDCRGAIPWSKWNVARRIVVNGFGFQDEFSAAGFDARESWDLEDIRIEMVQRRQHAGVRLRTGLFNGGTGRYAAMFCTVRGGMIAACGAQINALQPGSQQLPQMPGHAATGIAWARPVPVPILCTSKAQAQSTGGAGLVYTFTTTFEPEPFRPIEICVVTRLSATPTLVEWGGLTFVPIPGTQVDGGPGLNTYRMTRWCALPSFGSTDDGRDWSSSWYVQAASTANVNLAANAPPTMDGVTLAANGTVNGHQHNGYVLLKNQTLPRENGIRRFTSTAAPLGLPIDANDQGELAQGIANVLAGTVNGGKFWRMTTPMPFTVGTTDLTWAQVTDGSEGFSKVPNTPIVSAPFNPAVPVRVTFSTAQQTCFVGVTMWKYGSSWCGKQPQVQEDAVWFYDYQSHGLDNYRNSISHVINPGGVAGLYENNALPAFDAIGPTYDGATVENVIGTWFFNTVPHDLPAGTEPVGTANRLLTATSDVEVVLTHLANTPGTDANNGQCLQLFYKPFADTKIGGNQGGSDTFLVSASEARGIRPFP